MKKKWIKKILCLACSVFLCSSVPVQAMSSIGPVTFHGISEKVQIRLETFSNVDGKEQVWEKKILENVLPGEKISRITRIFNREVDCYVRAAVNFGNKKKDGPVLTEECLNGMGKEWIKRGEYFYYTQVLPRGKTVDLFREITVPAEWTQEQCAGGQWEIQVEAEAVQAEHVKPDFSSEDPWGMEKEGFEILKAGEEQVPETKTDNRPVELVLSEGMKQFAVEDHKFFREPEPFVPGDVRKGTIDLLNETGGSRKVDFHIEADETNPLLQKMELVVKVKDGKSDAILYQGSVCGTEVRKQQTVGMFQQGERKQLEFEIRLPEEADNQYAAKEGKIKVFFHTDTDRTKKTERVQTSDPVSANYVWSLVLSAGLILMIFRKREGFLKGGSTLDKNM